jgi:hypothetical protein
MRRKTNPSMTRAGAPHTPFRSASPLSAILGVILLVPSVIILPL